MLEYVACVKGSGNLVILLKCGRHRKPAVRRGLRLKVFFQEDLVYVAKLPII